MMQTLALSAILDDKWAQEAANAILAAAKSQVGIARLHYSLKEVMRPGTDQVDRVEIVLTMRAPQ